MELYVQPERITVNAKNGRFLKGHIPHNKGKKWSDYMDMRKAKKVKRIALNNLKPNPKIGGWNKKQVIGIKDGKLICCFDSSETASKKYNLIARNIRHCCEGKRKRCGKIYWFWESDYEKWSKYINN